MLSTYFEWDFARMVSMQEFPDHVRGGFFRFAGRMGMSFLTLAGFLLVARGIMSKVSPPRLHIHPVLCRNALGRTVDDPHPGA